MEERFNAIYTRQSIDRPDSISIESQTDFCKYELRGSPFRTYCDKGFSGKNTDRPAFQQMMHDIRAGLIQKVVVYKLDRISRSILDFANMMEQFQQYHVEFISSTEKFDTSTPMGRAMLNICIVFAQLERETIQKRVTDAYYSRIQKGFLMGGVVPFGFHTEPINISGINTKQLVANPDEADLILQVYELYAKPNTSYGDVVQLFTERGILVGGKPLSRMRVGTLLRNPVYVQADLSIYEFFKEQGSEIVNAAADFTGTNGCYLYNGRNSTRDKNCSLEGQVLVLAPHHGFVPSDLWLQCRRKQLANKRFQSGRKAIHTWLAGKLKCGHCGYALASLTNAAGVDYLRCTEHAKKGTCPGAGPLYTRQVEAEVFRQMREKLLSYRILSRTPKASAANPQILDLKIQMAQVNTEISQLMDSLTGANAILISYVNEKISALDAKKHSLQSQLADLTTTRISPSELREISASIDNWESVDFVDKRQIADLLIDTVSATSERVQVTWKPFPTA